MHEVDGSLVDREVTLDRGALGRTVEFASAVETSEKNAKGPIANHFDQRVVDVEDHGSDDNITDGAEPTGVEVWERAGSEAKGEGLFGQVGVDHEEEEGRVEELHEEGDGSGLLEANSLG